MLRKYEVNEGEKGAVAGCSCGGAPGVLVAVLWERSWGMGVAVSLGCQVGPAG